jgi:peptide/nickel transport system substrate-binding protein
MKKFRWQLIIVVAALAAIGLLLVGQQTQDLPEIQAPVEKPSQGGQYREAIVGSPGRLNPLLDWMNPADHAIDRLIYSSLIRFDERSVPQGDLADSWAVSQDGKTYNFLLREAQWHDGQPLTTEDIVFTANLLRSDEIPIPEDLKEFWRKIEVEALDQKVVQFRIPEPYAPFLDYLTFGILPKHIWDGIPPEEITNSSLNLTPVGSGPYQFEQFTMLDGAIKSVNLVVNHEYFGKVPFIERISFDYYPDSASALNAYQEGEGGENDTSRVMGVDQIPAGQLQTFIGKTGINLYTGIMPRQGMVMLNLENQQVTALQDANVRRALYFGLNRQKIVDQTLNGQAILATGPIIPSSWAYYDGLEQTPYNPDKAISLLKDAEFDLAADGDNVRAKGDVRLEFELAFPDIGPYPAIANSIKSDWEKIGVAVNLKAVPANTMVKDILETKAYQIALVELNGMRYPDPDPYPFWHQSQAARGQNYSQWNDRQASEFLEQARTQVDPEIRSQLYKNFQIRFMSELPSFPLFYIVYSFGAAEEVQGVRAGPVFDPADRFANISDWYLFTSQGTTATATPAP